MMSSPITSTFPAVICFPQCEQIITGFAEQGAGAQLPPRASDSIGFGSLIFSVPGTLAVGRQWLSLVVMRLSQPCLDF